MVKSGWSNDALDDDPSLADVPCDDRLERERDRLQRQDEVQRQRRERPNARWVRLART